MSKILTGKQARHVLAGKKIRVRLKTIPIKTPTFTTAVPLGDGSVTACFQRIGSSNDRRAKYLVSVVA